MLLFMEYLTNILSKIVYYIDYTFGSVKHQAPQLYDVYKFCLLISYF